MPPVVRDRHRPIPVDSIVEDVVIEAAVAGNALDQLGDVRLGVLGIVADCNPVVVPVAAGIHVFKPERVGGHGSIDQPVPIPADHEGLPVAAALDLISAARSDEVFLPGIDWKQDPEPAVGIVVEDHQVPVVAALDLDLGPFAFAELAAVVDPDPDRGCRRVDRGRSLRNRISRGEKRRR